MKYSLGILLFGSLAVLGAIMLLRGEEPTETDTFRAHFPCQETVTWKPGQIDPRFGISRDELRSLMEEVSALWSGAADSRLIRYSEEGEIALNFIYSEEQQHTDSKQQLSERIETEKELFKEQERRYHQSSDRFQNEMATHNRNMAAYNERVNRYNRLIARWNTTGTIPPGEQEKLDALEGELRQSKSDLERSQQRLARQKRALEHLSGTLNDRVNRINELIYIYEDRYSDRGSFHQGVYLRAGGEQKINIYQFENRQKLKLVLAHEVGHALGLTHVDNPRSVMYYLMEQQDTQDLRLSREDRTALRSRCEG